WAPVGQNMAFLACMSPFTAQHQILPGRIKLTRLQPFSQLPCFYAIRWAYHVKLMPSKSPSSSASTRDIARRICGEKEKKCWEQKRWADASRQPLRQAARSNPS